jgi:hypothetical protein
MYPARFETAAQHVAVLRIVIHNQQCFSRRVACLGHAIFFGDRIHTLIAKGIHHLAP